MTNPPPSDDVEKVLAAVDGRNSLIVRLARNVEALVAEVRKLRREVAVRPTEQQVAHNRRTGFALLILFGTLLVWGHDAHVENCGPGARSEAVIMSITDDGRPTELTSQRIERLVEREQPTAACDVTFPLYSHGVTPEGGWGPWSTWNLVGFAGYGVAGAMIAVWRRGPRA